MFQTRDMVHVYFDPDTELDVDWERRVMVAMMGRQLFRSWLDTNLLAPLYAVDRAVACRRARRGSVGGDRRTRTCDRSALVVDFAASNERPESCQDQPPRPIGPTVAAWKGPGWAESSETDDDVVVFARPLGSVLDVTGVEQEVMLFQRDEIRATADAVTIDRQPAYMILGSTIQVDVAAMDQLAQILASGVQLVGGPATEPDLQGSPEPV